MGRRQCQRAMTRASLCALVWIEFPRIGTRLLVTGVHSVPAGSRGFGKQFRSALSLDAVPAGNGG